MFYVRKDPTDPKVGEKDLSFWHWFTLANVLLYHNAPIEEVNTQKYTKVYFIIVFNIKYIKQAYKE